jgi:DNA-binding response OmpR family regulator
VPPTILLADEGHAARRILASTLRCAGYRVVEAPDGAAAWEEIPASAPDLVILEALLPRKTGFALCADLKGNDRTRRIPVILMSSLSRLAGGSDEAWRAKTCADDFLSRPFDLGDLLSRIERLMDVRGRGSAICT